MPKEKFRSPEVNEPVVFLPLNPRLIPYDKNQQYYIKTTDGFMLYADSTKTEVLLSKMANNRLPQLYVEANYKRRIFREASSHYLSSLKKSLEKEEVNKHELALIVTEWVDISLMDMGVDATNETLASLDTFISEFLTGYGTENILELLKIIKDMDYSSAQHSIEMMIFTLCYFDSLPKANSRLNQVGAIASLLHDVGKRKLPAEIIMKNGPLTADEYEVAKEHVMLGVEILTNIDFEAIGFSIDEANMIIRGALEHHEREDGSGYPRGLKGSEISLFGKILAVLDVYTAMITETRPYRKGVSSKEALDTLKSEVAKGKLYPEAVAHLELALKKLR